MTTIYLTIFFGIILLSVISDAYKDYTGEDFEIPQIQPKLIKYKERIIENVQTCLKR